MHVPVTLLYGSLCLLLVGVLGLNVSRVRLATRTFIGDEPAGELKRLVRAHGNAIEYAPFQILMLLLLELAGVASMPLHVLGGAIFAGRLLHAGGIYLKNPLSTVGATISYVVTLAMGCWGLLLHFRG